MLDEKIYNKEIITITYLTMDSFKNCFLVPYDFSEVADNAVNHAVVLSKVRPAEVVLLNIVKKDTEIEETQVKIAAEAQRLSEKFNKSIKFIVKEGTIFKSIGSLADELDAIMVVMGTHGIKGMQKLTGSWALKVIIGSRVPFLVVQGAPSGNAFNNIIFPVDFKSENKEKLRWAEFMGKDFKSKILLYSNTTKEGVMDHRTKANLTFCKRFLEDSGIDFELALSEGGNGNAQEILSYAEKVNADLIMVMTTRDIAFHDYILGATEQYIISNSAKIPVMVINPRSDLMKYGYGGFAG